MAPNGDSKSVASTSPPGGALGHLERCARRRRRRSTPPSGRGPVLHPPGRPCHRAAKASPGNPKVPKSVPAAGAGRSGSRTPSGQNARARLGIGRRRSSQTRPPGRLTKPAPMCSRPATPRRPRPSGRPRSACARAGRPRQERAAPRHRARPTASAVGIGVVGRQVERPGRRPAGLPGTDAGRRGAVDVGDHVAAVLVASGLDRPAEHLGVEGAGTANIRHREIHPAGNAWPATARCGCSCAPIPGAAGRRLSSGGPVMPVGCPTCLERMRARHITAVSRPRLRCPGRRNPAARSSTSCAATSEAWAAWPRRCSVGQPMMSKHLKVLRDAGFVSSHVRQAQQRIYRLKSQPLEAIDAWLRPYRELWTRHLDALGEGPRPARPPGGPMKPTTRARPPRPGHRPGNPRRLDARVRPRPAPPARAGVGHADRNPHS